MGITRTDKIDPAILLMEGLAAAERTGDSSNAIYAQEARGQAEFVGESGRTLPADGISDCPWAKVLGPVEGDPLFVRVELPPGWTVKATDHSMWSDVLDDKGRRRAGAFYKAASYDRCASINPCQAVTVDRDYDYKDGVRYRVVDHRGPEPKTLLETTGPGKGFFDVPNTAHDEATEWLEAQGWTLYDQGLWDVEETP